ncbi:MAG: PAS domain-containing sensor histidine kinase [Actinomycetota bacterium]
MTQAEGAEDRDVARLILDAAACAMVSIDAEGTIRLANREAARIFSTSIDELVGRPVELLVPERHRRDHVELRRGFLGSPSARAMGGDRELWARRLDGTEFPVEVGLTPMDDRGNVMVTLIDISERLAHQEAIRHQTEQLRRLHDDLNQFAYSASHDLKAPLATIDGIAGCILDDLGDGDLSRAHEDVEEIRRLVRRQGELVEGILDFARDEHREITATAVVVSELLDQLGRDLAAQLDTQQVELRPEVDDGLVIRTDRRGLRQILGNLVANGAKFADPAADERYVAVSAREQGGTVTISVTDNGRGIPAEAHDDVFKMFQRFHHDTEGSGLGLAMVKRQVTRLGGDIDFVSSPAGTRFSISLPTSDDDPSAQA